MYFKISSTFSKGSIAKAVVFIMAAFVVAGCRMNPNIQGRGTDYLQGVWQQDSIPGQSRLLTSSLSAFKFDCDSFYITINTASKINSGADSCMNKGKWAEYIRGTYRQQGDTLLLHGFFHNADGSLKEANTCFRHGPYDEIYHVSQKSDSLIIFSGKSVVLPVKLHLIKRTTCVPKPLK